MFHPCEVRVKVCPNLRKVNVCCRVPKFLRNQQYGIKNCLSNGAVLVCLPPDFDLNIQRQAFINIFDFEFIVKSDRYGIY